MKTKRILCLLLAVLFALSVLSGYADKPTDGGDKKSAASRKTASTMNCMKSGSATKSRPSFLIPLPSRGQTEPYG